LRGDCKVEISSVTGMPKKRVYSMSDELMVRVLFVPDQMREVAFASEKRGYSQSFT
jgi:hypothetical protein